MPAIVAVVDAGRVAVRVGELASAGTTTVEVAVAVSVVGRAAVVGVAITETATGRVAAVGGGSVTTAGGVAVAVADACPDVVACADYVTTVGGGCGAVREAVEWLLRCQGLWQQVIEQYQAQGL